MSIATELEALNTNIKNAYDAIDTKGGTIPQNKNMVNLTTAIASIPAGGGRDDNWDKVYSGETTQVYDGNITSLRVNALLPASSSYTYITGIDFPNLIEINTSAFANQDKITSFNLPKLKTINGSSNFSVCTGYTEIKLPSLDTLLSTGSQSVFQSNTSVKKIDLGNNQTSVSGQFGGNMFRYNTNLKALILRWNNVIQISASTALRDTGIASGTGYIYVPSNLVNSYKSTIYWSTYPNQIRAIEDYSDDGTVEGNITV